ncbi:hypothetical protein [Streptomyces sp. SID12501]|uniref:Recombinase family protein n=1 Tax=Streptomyces sp. SID12501 TaxID=2706042 RepID=A0A6B3BQ72_9ACTN|nr:hypothetical protein [Streptomyces sp. SID12501]NEC86443.1 hypothetical protein [Streptomyces sp. SID12501]
MHQPRPDRAVVAYLCTTVHTDPQPLLHACDVYARRKGWRVVDVQHDTTGQSDPTNPHQRPALARAIETLSTTEASALLTVSAEMISPLSTERAQVTSRVKHAGGFIHAMGWAEVRSANRRSP